MQATGQQVLNSTVSARTNLLVELELNLEQLNGKRQAAARVPNTAFAGQFLVSDFIGIDQAKTTATVRANTQSVTLRERPTPTDAVILNTTFLSSDGTVAAQPNGIYQVSVSDGGVPVGTFLLQLSATYNISLVTFDILSMPSSPQITVLTSATNVTYNVAPQVSQNGYQVTAWFPPATVQYIQLQITPAVPDTLNGNVYSFGITDFSAAAIAFELKSELVTLPIELLLTSASMRFVADTDPNLTYFLSWDGKNFFQANVGDIVTVPGSTVYDSGAGITLDDYGQLGVDLPAYVYPGTLSIVDGSGTAYRIAPGLKAPPYNAQNGYMMIPQFPWYEVINLLRNPCLF